MSARSPSPLDRSSAIDPGRETLGAVLLPNVSSEQEWRAVHARPLADWRPALLALNRAWGLDGEWERLPGGEDSAVFAQGSTVVKWVPPFATAHAEHEVEVLRRLDRSVPAPRVLDVRREEEWTAVRLTRLEGVPAAQVWSEVPPPDRRRILVDVGTLLRTIWRTPLAGSDEGAAALLARLRTRALRHEGEGFADPAGYLERHLPNPLPGPALLHFDLNDGNVMLARRRGRWEMSGALDFVASRAFYPPLDLVTPGLFFCRGDPALLAALLEGAGAGDMAADALTAWHLLHPFSSLRRDIAMTGRTPSGVPSLERLWRTP